MGCSKGSGQGKTNYRVLSGEEAVIDIEASEEWKSKLQNLLNEYPPEKSVQCSWNRIVLQIDAQKKRLVQRGEKCKGGKRSKERLSVPLCCSATGERLRLLVTGDAAWPHVFKEHVEIAFYVLLQQKAFDDHGDIWRMFRWIEPYDEERKTENPAAW